MISNIKFSALFLCVYTICWLNIAQGQNAYVDSLLGQLAIDPTPDSLDINRLSILQKAFTESNESGSGHRIEEICWRMGNFFFNYGLFNNAIDYYNHALTSVSKGREKSDVIIDIYRKIGQSFSNLRQPDSAFYYYSQIFEEFDFPEKLDVYRDLVDIYAANGEHQKSLEYNLYIEDLLLDNQSSAKEMSMIYNNIGYSFHRLNQYENSIQYFNRALAIYPSLPDNDRQSIMINLSISHYNQGNYKGSLDLLTKVVSKVGEKGQNAELYHLLGTVHHANRDYLRAISNLKRAESLAKQSKDNEILSDIFAGFANVYTATHEYDLAFDYFRKYSKLSDSLSLIQQLNQRRILDNQKYIERAEKEIQLLRTQQKLQQLQIDQLETLTRNQELQNKALKADSIQAADQLLLARQKNEIAEVNEVNNLLEIARKNNLIAIANQQLEIFRANEENSRIESERQLQQLTLAQQTNDLLERNTQLRAEQAVNEQSQLEIAQRKIAQRNTFVLATLFAALALLVWWAYRNKKKDNKRLSLAYDDLNQAQINLKAAESRIKILLKQQVSGVIAEALMSDMVVPDDEQLFACVMFLDIRDFTLFCEGRKPSEIIAYQNSVFGFMINIVEKNHGVVNQLMGDGFMASFGAPISKGNDCLNAYTAARQIIKNLNDKTNSGEIFPTKIGIGIHAGHVVAGNVGNEERKQFSISGNTVNLAARIEQLNKEFGSTLVYSREFYGKLPNDIREDVEFKSVMVKGHSTPIEVAVYS